MMYFLLGGLWYSLVFNKPWLEGLQYSEEELKEFEKGFSKLFSSLVFKRPYKQLYHGGPR